MKTYQPEHGRHAFVVGLLAGTCVGAGLAMWLAPRGASELGKRLGDSARDLGERAAEGYEQAGARVSSAVADLARKGQDFRDDVAGAVARSAHGVEEFATAAMSGRR
jgi:gas vesicle protein